MRRFRLHRLALAGAGVADGKDRQLRLDVYSGAKPGRLLADVDRRLVGSSSNSVMLARLDRLTGGRYSRACEQDQSGPLGQVCALSALS